MTYLEAINAVLRRLREDTASASSNSDYSKLIATFVNQAIYDCEHAHDWNVLKETITVTTAAADELYDMHTADIKILSAINETKNWVMRVIPADYQHRLEYLDTPISESPYYYSMLSKNGTSSQVKVYPIPTAVESLRFLTIKHTPEYKMDGTDDSSEIVIPSHPVVLKAYALAVSERGEDGGLGYAEADEIARSALADSISMDVGLQHQREASWHVY